MSKSPKGASSQAGLPKTLPATAVFEDSDPSCELRQVHPEMIERALRAQPSAELIVRSSELLKAIADPTRLKLLAALRETELCVCDLAVVVGISESGVSHSLKILRNAGLVSFRRDGRTIYYHLADAHVVSVLENAFEHVLELQD